MYHELFACLVYDFYGLKLCTIYDSYAIYLCVLWTIYMYKFSKCHAVVFHGFFVPFTNFRQKMTGFQHKPPENYHISFLKNRLIYRPNQPIYWCSRFHCYSITSGAFQPNFPNFHLIFSKTNGTSDVQFSWFHRIFEPCGNQRSVQGGRCTASHIQSSFSRAGQKGKETDHRVA
jgi:hypothetical protein